MRYSTVFKFIAVILCAAALLGAVGSAGALVALTELGGKSVEDAYRLELEQKAAAYAQAVGGAYFSGADEEFLLHTGQNARTDGIFNRIRVGYELKDPAGSVLQSRKLTDGFRPEHTLKGIPVAGYYDKVLSVTPAEDYGRVEDAQVLVMPARQVTPIRRITADYTDRTRQHWDGGEEALAELHLEGGELILRSASLGEIPEGDGWYVCHLVLEDMGGNVVYEAKSENALFLGSAQEASQMSWTLPAGTVTAAAPAGVTYEKGEFVSYDAIPEGGATVASLRLSYGTEEAGAMGSEGVFDAELLGTVFHDFHGNVRFQSREAMTLDVPEGMLILQITFLDGSGNVFYEAKCPSGVGRIGYEENGVLTYLEQKPGTRQTETTEATEVTEAAEITVAAEVTEATEVTEVTETVEVTAEEEQGYSPDQVQVLGYYDSRLQQDVVAKYVRMPIPEGYTLDLQLARGAMGGGLLWTLLALAEVLRPRLLPVLGISIAVFVLCVVHLCCTAARKRGTDTVRAGGLNRIPLDLYLVGGGCATVALAAAGIFGSDYFASADQLLAVLFFGGCAYLICMLIVGFFFAVVAQFKTPGGYWWRNSLCARCVRLLIRGCTAVADAGIKCCVYGLPRGKKCLTRLGRLAAVLWRKGKQTVLRLWDAGRRLSVWGWHMTKKWVSWFTKRMGRLFGQLPITWQFLATGFVLVFLLYIMMRTYKVGYILLGFGIFFAVILYAASAFAILLESARKMTEGDLDTKVDDRMLVGGFREFAGELNELADAAVTAAQKQLKSERMKTELITNVSHDIKTPLTSIINYVDLLRRAETQQQRDQCLEVLDRQSQRLKKLIDDLMEMSKASTGNMPVDIRKMDAVETVNQVLGEFADKLERARLTPVFRQPEEPVNMMADGRLVWRVMSNILGNAVKYALPGTRVYLDLMELDGKVILSVKNISREELNVNAEELLERFVRGDASRNTEGSGLGLNIAQSLMQLQKGQLEILVDGDLFKVTLVFPSE